MERGHQSPVDHLRAAFAALGMDVDPEMAETPERVAELLAGFAPAPPPELSILPTSSGDLITCEGLPFHSLCAHHLLPFFGTCAIALRPAGRIAGLGGYPRLVAALARRPQLQERLAAQIAETLMAQLEPASVGVKLVARQLCVEMRGARSAGNFTIRAFRGGDDAALRAALG